MKTKTKANTIRNKFIAVLKKSYSSYVGEGRTAAEAVTALQRQAGTINFDKVTLHQVVAIRKPKITVTF